MERKINEKIKSGKIDTKNVKILKSLNLCKIFTK
jgi:hypothetical protein